MTRILVLFAHPSLEKSRTNRSLLRAITGLEGVAVRDLYELYPDFDIDVRAEQAALLAHDLLVFQHPFYWYSIPPLLKQWLDLVLEHGWAYGRGGAALVGKRVVHATTTGGSADAYRPEGLNRYSITEFLRPLEQSARLCGMTWLDPFVVHGTHQLASDEIERHAAAYRRLLLDLRDAEPE